MIRSNMIDRNISSSAPVALVQANPRRMALVFSPPLSGVYTVSLDAGMAEGAGLALSAGTGAITITRVDFGDALDRAWYARAVSGVDEPHRVGALESFEM